MVVAGGIIVYSFGKGAARPKVHSGSVCARRACRSRGGAWAYGWCWQRDVDEEMGWKGLPQHRADILESSSSSLALSVRVFLALARNAPRESDAGLGGYR